MGDFKADADCGLAMERSERRGSEIVFNITVVFINKFIIGIFISDDTAIFARLDFFK